MYFNFFLSVTRNVVSCENLIEAGGSAYCEKVNFMFLCIVTGMARIPREKKEREDKLYNKELHIVTSYRPGGGSQDFLAAKKYITSSCASS